MYTDYHIIMYARKSAPLCTDVGGAYGGQWASDGVRQTPRTRPPYWVRRGLQGQCYRTWGVVNLRDKCGVCDDVTG